MGQASPSAVTTASDATWELQQQQPTASMPMLPTKKKRTGCCGDSSTSSSSQYSAHVGGGVGKLMAFFMFVVPMSGAIALALVWFCNSRESVMLIEAEEEMIRRQTLQLGKLIIDFNTERELTAIYVTARTSDTQLAAKVDLDVARQQTDRSLSALVVWPPSTLPGDDSPPMFRSSHLFAAILGGHRAAVRVGLYFWDEVQFYADVIDVTIGWLDRCIGGTATSTTITTSSISNSRELISWRTTNSSGRLAGLLQSYGYLMASVSYVGAEQALCSVFHSFVCFSHRETFYYANYSFGGEAIFRLYRHSYPTTSVAAVDAQAAAVGDRPPGWRTAEHRTFFPELSACRQEIVADLDYIGMSTDPSLCSASRKNETRFDEVELLTVVEARRLASEIIDELEATTDAVRRQRTISGLASLVAVAYAVTAVAAHCFVSRCTASRKSARGSGGRKRKQAQAASLYHQQQQQQQQRRLPPLQTSDNSCGCTTTAMDGDVQLLYAGTTDNCCFTNDLIADTNHKMATTTSMTTSATSFPALKVACV